MTNNALSLFFQEAIRLKRAMKDEEFRKLLTDYAQEIHNPENRAVITKNSRSQSQTTPHKLLLTFFMPVVHTCTDGVVLVDQ